MTNGQVLLVLSLIGYFFPTIVAGSRRHHQSSAIFVTNLLLGWTVIGWIVAFIWSATAINPALVSKRPRPD